MRILHVTDVYRPQLGGIELFVDDLAHRQAAAGHEVSVLTAAAADPAGPADVGPVRVLRTPPTMRHPLASPAAREAALTGSYDVVHAHLSVLSPFATTIGRVADEAGIGTVNTVHSMLRSRRAVIRVVRSLADWDRSGALWTAVSQAAAAEMRDVLHPATGVQVVPNAVDVDWWRAGTPHRPSAAPVTIVSVMRLAGRKRPVGLIEVLQRVRANLDDAVPLRAVIVGDGPLERRIQHEIRTRGLADVVALAGRLSREEIRTLYGRADIYVAPAYEESFGLAALEARAAGLPVVAMESGGVREFVAHGVEGFLCGDDDAMVSALTALASDQALRATISAHNASHRPVQDWSGTLAGFDEAYRAVRRVHELGRGPGQSSARAS
jgi:glycosyltransferase involved in cell wall biosynthesis